MGDRIRDRSTENSIVATTLEAEVDDGCTTLYRVVDRGRHDPGPRQSDIFLLSTDNAPRWTRSGSSPSSSQIADAVALRPAAGARTELTRITTRSAQRWVKDSRSAEEILGYGPDGLPS